MFKKIKLHHKLLLSLFFITSFSTIVTLSFSIYFFSHKIKQEAVDNMRKNMQVSHTFYQQHMNDVAKITHFLSHDTQLQNFSFFNLKKRIIPYLEQLRHREKLQQVIVFNVAKKTLHHSSTKIVSSFANKDFEHNPLVKRALNQRKTMAAIEHLKQADLPSVLTITSVSPIFDKTIAKKTVAVVMVRYVLNANQYLVNTLYDLLGASVSIYHDSQIIVAQAQEYHLSSELYKTLEGYPKNQNHEIIIMKKGGYLAEYKGLYDIENNMVAVLAVQISANKYIDTTNKAIMNFIIIMLLCLSIAFLLGYIISRQIVIPINKLLIGVTRVSSGDLSHTIKTNTHDELGTLAQAFNSMAQQLNESFNVFRNTISTLTHVSTALSAEKNFNNLLDLFVTEACRVTHADGGTLYTVRDDHLIFRVVRNQSLQIHQGGSSNQKITLPALPLLPKDENKVSVYVALHKKIIHATEVYNSSDFDFSATKAYDRAMGYKTHSMLVVPLLDRSHQTVGVLQLINPINKKTTQHMAFTANSIEVVKALASQAAVALENARNYRKINTKNEAFRRFVPTEFIAHLGKSEVEDINLGDASREHMSVLFSDIRSFTTLSEAMTPEENFLFLNDYLQFIVPDIMRHGGFVDKYIGDAIMALFSGKYISVADDAVQAGVDMLAKLKLFNLQRNVRGLNPINIGIGINTGELTLGTIGYKDRMDNTVIGDTVNLASRIEGLTKQYGIDLAITSYTLAGLKDKNKFLTRELDTVQVKGKESAVTVYEVFNADDEQLLVKKLETLEEYEAALELYKNQQWQKAFKLFKSLTKQWDDEPLFNLYLQRCRHYQLNPPSPQWSGITRLAEK